MPRVFLEKDDFRKNTNFQWLIYNCTHTHTEIIIQDTYIHRLQYAGFGGYVHYHRSQAMSHVMRVISGHSLFPA